MTSWHYIPHPKINFKMMITFIKAFDQLFIKTSLMFNTFWVNKNIANSSNKTFF